MKVNKKKTYLIKLSEKEFGSLIYHLERVKDEYTEGSEIQKEVIDIIEKMEESK